MAAGADGAMPVHHAGVCSPGFVSCAGLCLESAVMGPDCHPIACAASHAAPPMRAAVTSRGFDWNVAFAGNTATVTFHPAKVVERWHRPSRSI